MNQEQRKFLIEQVNTTYKVQSDKLKHQIPIKPSLNNYLVAAFLDNSIQFNDIDALKRKIRETVIRMGKGDVLVKEESDGWRNEKPKLPTVNVLAEDIFVLPENYLDALKEYETIKNGIEKEIDVLEEKRRTIIMKIQIGSNVVLDKLVAQVDNMADLNIMNSQLLLTQ